METNNPLSEVSLILDEAIAAGVTEPTAVCLATATSDGTPSARMMLLKGIDARGFVLYTNMESRKARELRENARAALVFFWAAIGRQVRVEGTVELVTDAEADEYFASRPRGSQIGAWASRQSRPLRDRDELLDAVAACERHYEGVDVPRPPHWTGFRVVPGRIEIWTAHAFRLHERRIYERVGESGWDTWMEYP